MYRGEGDHRAYECSVEQLSYYVGNRKTWKVSGFKMAGLERNTYNDHGTMKNRVPSLETVRFLPNLKHAQHISLGCAPREFYFLFLKAEHLLNSQSQRTLFCIKQIKEMILHEHFLKLTSKFYLKHKFKNLEFCDPWTQNSKLWDLTPMHTL